jgi:hypothetical protein
MSTFQLSIQLNEDVEYFVSLSGATRALKWPACAPALPHTVIVV